MKRIFIILVFLHALLIGFSQVTESKSEKVFVRMSKDGSGQKKETGEIRNTSDIIPPKIIIQVPAITPDSLVESNSVKLFIKGTIQDEGGISSVKVNGKEAYVSSDGQFIIEVLQNSGRNIIKLVATDISNNRASLQFYSNVLNSEAAPSGKTSFQKLPGSSLIEISEPSETMSATSNNRINLKGCIRTANPIEQLLIYRDGYFVTGYPASQITTTSNCSNAINASIKLNLGFNEIRLEVFTEKDTIQKSIYIDYSLYAARNFALLIGNENYDDARIMDLSEPLKDVTALYKTLLGQYNFDSVNVMLLKNPTKAEIIGTLHHLRSQINSSDNLLIFYAGHGIWDAEMQMGYWLPKDASKDNPVNWIPNTDLTNYIGAIKSKHTLLIADACFSGGIFKTSRAINKSLAIELLYEMNSRKAITSGTLSEVPDRSIFFQYLLKNLTENANPYISSSELFSNMREAVINNSEIVPQFGTIQNVGDEGGDYIFIQRKPGKN
jgi:hypothetical protein